MLSFIPARTAVHGLSNARLEVWSPTVHSSNITDPGLTSGPLQFPVGTTFNVLVNLTYPGNIAAFDIALHYNLTYGPNVLQAIRTGNELTGGIIDPNNHSYGSGCNAGILESDIDGGGSQPGSIRIGADLVGSTCNLPTGTGILFTLTFKVTGIGTGSIDIDDGTGNGSTGTNITGVVSGDVIVVAHDSFSAIFRNKAGLPPVPVFTFKPDRPVLGQRVTMNATGSYDPEHQNVPDHGIQAEPVVYDANGNNIWDSGENVILGSPTAGASLSSDTRLGFVDANGNRKWDLGETVVYSSTGALTFRSTDVVISGTVPLVGMSVASDPNIKYVELHPNHIWDNGYVWDFGDGTPIVPGVVASHVFTSGGVIPAAGVFEVKLAVYDTDDGLAMRQVEPVTVGYGIRHDVVVTLTVSALQIVPGDPLTITVELTNRGNRNETVNINTNYTLNSGTTIGKEDGIHMSLGSQTTRLYPLVTTSLRPDSYIITSQATMVNATTGAVVPYSDPSDSVARATFLVRAPSPQTFVTLPILVGSALGAVIAVSAVVYLVRRRRLAREEA